MAENSLVAHSESPSGLTTSLANPIDVKSGALNEDFAGTGLFSDAASTITDAADGDWLGLGIDLGTDALDLLGAAMNPLGTLASAGVGWLIEHISFLKKGLDLLAGDPEAVTAKAVTWKNISTELTATAGDYERAARAVGDSWTNCGSADGYQASAQNYAATLRGAASHAGNASTAMNVAAALVGVERGLIRDMISSFVGELIIKGLAAMASSWCTFGASVAALIADTMAEGAALATRISGKITTLVSKLSKIAESAGKSKGVIQAAAKALEKAGKGLDKLAQKAHSAESSLRETSVSLSKAAEEAKSVKAATRAEEWKDSFRDHTTGAAMDKFDEAKSAAKAKLGIDEDHFIPSTRDRVGRLNERFGEDKRGDLSPEKWQQQIDHRLHDGWEMHSPGWNTADSAGSIAETGRQTNEQQDRWHEAREAHKRETEPPEPTATGED